VHFLVNPAAAGGRLRREWPRVRERLAALGIEVVFTWTARPGHASELAASLAERGEDVVVAVGGDGTVDEVLQGLHAAGRGALGILPLGTGNDCARTLGIPLGLPRAAAVLAQPELRRVDLLSAGGRVVLNAVGVGLLGAINVNAAALKWVRGMPAYLAAGVGTLAQWRCPEIELRTAEATYVGPMTILAVHNGVTTGGGFPLCPAARPDDGALDVTLVTATTVVSRLGAIADCLRGTLGRRSFTRELVAPRIELACDEPLPCHWDGNPAEIAPPGLCFEVLPGALEVVAPAGPQPPAPDPGA
jgi:diacylglycerol kinase (ATP)